MSDKELLQAIEHKDERAFNIFYEKYARGLAQFALKCTRDENLTKDIVQLFWIRLWENPMEIKTDESGSAYRYLTKFFTFRMLDILKERTEKKEVYCEYIEDFDIQSYDISDGMDMKELYSIIDMALNSLPDASKEIFKMQYVDELSVGETAQILNINERTVRYKSQECIDSIRKSLDSWYATKKTSVPRESNLDFTDLMRNVSFAVIVQAHFYFEHLS